MERMGSVIKLGKCRIYCSEKCQSEQIDAEEKERELLEGLKKIEDDCKEKDAYIERLRRRTQDFEDEVENAEGKYVRELLAQKNMIVALNREIDELRKRNEQWLGEFEEKKQLVIKLEKDIEELNKLNREMISTIRTLEEDNWLHLNGLKGLKERVLTVESGGAEHREPVDGHGVGVSGRRNERPSGLLKNKSGVRVNVPVCSKPDRNRLLILCDETGRRLNKIMSKQLAGWDVRVESVIKPGARLGGVIDSLPDLTKNYTFNDHVLIMAGQNDIRSGKYPSFRVLNDKLKICSNTNVLLASVPYMASCALNRRIYRFNMRLYEYSLRVGACRRGKVEFLDVNGRGVAVFDEAVIAEKAANIVGKRGCTGNLIFIDTADISGGQVAERGCLDPETPSILMSERGSFLMRTSGSLEVT